MQNRPEPRVPVHLLVRVWRMGADGDCAGAGGDPSRGRHKAADRSKSLAAAGAREGLFLFALSPVARALLNIRVVYRFENEQLLELINRTAHAAALSALVETAYDYRFYFGVYVRSVGRFTPVYMALIDPFRKLVVYPSLLRTVRATWNQTFGAA